MKMPEIKLNKDHIFSLFTMFWIGLGILGLFLAILGIFYKTILFVYLIIFGLLFLCLFFSNIKVIKIKWPFLIVLTVSLLAIFVFSHFTTPTIFSGRDQGSLSGAAIYLSQNHRLDFSFEAEKSFFDIYGTGKALNFPGFNYLSDGSLKTSFPLGYVSWLAIFYSLFGLNGFIVANGLTFLIFILSFYLMARIFLKSGSAVTLILLILTSFVFSWFFKFTLSENLALGFLWFSIYEFILFLKNEERFFLVAAFLSMGLLTFARIEALAFFFMMIVALFFKYKNWKKILSAVGWKTISVAGGIATIYLISLWINKEFFVILAKAVLKPFFEIGSDLPKTRDAFSFFYVSHIFIVYALFNFLILGIAGIIYAFRQKKWELLVPFLIVLPTFVYLFLPNISADSPWMLRRFLFAVIPICIFYTIWILDVFLIKSFYFYAVSAALLFANLTVFMPYLNFSPNQNLLSQTKSLSEKFNDSDLILIDKDATGDQWSMLAGPLNFLYGKQAVYFFNPEDIKKINSNKFSEIYFIIPDKNIALYEKVGLFERLSIASDYTIKNNVLDISNCFELPEKRDIMIIGKIYLLN